MSNPKDIPEIEKKINTAKSKVSPPIFETQKKKLEETIDKHETSASIDKSNIHNTEEWPEMIKLVRQITKKIEHSNDN